MEYNSNNKLPLTDEEVKERVLRGTQLAVDRLIERKRREDGYLVVEQNGKVVTLRARDILTSQEARNAKTP